MLANPLLLSLQLKSLTVLGDNPTFCGGNHLKIIHKNLNNKTHTFIIIVCWFFVLSVFSVVQSLFLYGPCPHGAFHLHFFKHFFVYHIFNLFYLNSSFTFQGMCDQVQRLLWVSAGVWYGAIHCAGFCQDRRWDDVTVKHFELSWFMTNETQ